MARQRSDLNSLMAVLGYLERQYPGSVVIDETTGVITLTGWRLEQFNDTQNNKESAGEVKHQPVQPNKFGLEVLETLTNEEIQKAREVAERIAASTGFYVRKG